MTLQPVNPLLIVALIFAAGHMGGIVARRLHMPSVTGNILSGLIMGPSMLGLFSEHTARMLEPVTIFAMGLMTVVIGGHLSYRRLHNAKLRIILVTFFEVTFTGGLVFAAAWWATARIDVAVVLGAVAVATAPATVLAVFKEERAKGLMVKTSLAAVGLDNVICIILFAVATTVAGYYAKPIDGEFWKAALTTFAQLAVAVLFGSLAGWALVTGFRRKMIAPFSGLLFGVLVTTGGAELVGVSPLLANLAMGIFLGNSAKDGEQLVSALENFEPMVLTCFFTLAGVSLHLAALPAMGFLGTGYFVARALGKVVGGSLGAVLANAPARIRLGVGATLIPQAGLAIGLVVILQGDPRFSDEFIEIITTVVLATVVLNEIIGPPLVRKAVRAAGEAGMDRRRLVEFLQEEHILYPLKCDDRWDAIRKLGEFLIRTHGVTDLTLEELVESVEARERSFSTAVGSGVALPHARLSSGDEILGVMGICPRGVDFDAPDGESVRVIIMVATPEGMADRHLEVMAAVAGLMSDPEVRAHLLTARGAAEAYDIIEMGSKQGYNYFLED
jgi:mannitol/fructose-specific phosphotransferase system IIA component (Ntr-type)/Kef-type K+ transport system membrane component KefB